MGVTLKPFPGVLSGEPRNWTAATCSKWQQSGAVSLLQFRTVITPQKEIEVKELKDYSGEFRPSIRYEDLFKEVLAKLLKVYC